jgi:hypothetical protein
MSGTPAAVLHIAFPRQALRCAALASPTRTLSFLLARDSSAVREQSAVLKSRRHAKMIEKAVPVTNSLSGLGGW